MKTLNIKNPEAYRMAEAIATETGESMTAVVIKALREELERHQKREKKATVEELLSIANLIAREIKSPLVDHAEYLYDFNGLPE